MGRFNDAEPAYVGDKSSSYIVTKNLMAESVSGTTMKHSDIDMEFAMLEKVLSTLEGEHSRLHNRVVAVLDMSLGERLAEGETIKAPTSPLGESLRNITNRLEALADNHIKINSQLVL